MSVKMSETAQPSLLPPAHVLGIRVDRLSQQQTLAAITAFVERHRAEPTTSCEQVVTVNPEFVMMAQQHPRFRQCINDAALVVPDGIGIVWAMYYLGKPAPERVTGTDTLIKLTQVCAAKGYRLYLLG